MSLELLLQNLIQCGSDSLATHLIGVSVSNSKGSNGFSCRMNPFGSMWSVRSLEHVYHVKIDNVENLDGFVN